MSTLFRIILTCLVAMTTATGIAFSATPVVPEMTEHSEPRQPDAEESAFAESAVTAGSAPMMAIDRSDPVRLRNRFDRWGDEMGFVRIESQDIGSQGGSNRSFLESLAVVLVAAALIVGIAIMILDGFKGILN